MPDDTRRTATVYLNARVTPAFLTNVRALVDALGVRTLPALFAVVVNERARIEGAEWEPHFERPRATRSPTAGDLVQFSVRLPGRTVDLINQLAVHLGARTQAEVLDQIVRDKCSQVDVWPVLAAGNHRL